MATKFIRRGGKEWKCAWAALAAEFGAASQPDELGIEDWQYMGTTDGRHEFRHRAHPVHGRVVWSTPAVQS
jgi:hypothetical protein